MSNVREFLGRYPYTSGALQSTIYDLNTRNDIVGTLHNSLDQVARTEELTREVIFRTVMRVLVTMHFQEPGFEGLNTLVHSKGLVAFLVCSIEQDRGINRY